MTTVQTPPSRAHNTGSSPITVDHVADFFRRYPGESVTFYTRVVVLPALPGFTLRVGLPVGARLADHGGPAEQARPRITRHEGAENLIWRVERQAGDPACYEYRAACTVLPVTEDTVLDSRATVTVESEGQPASSVSASASVAVSAHGRYLEYLPAIYRDDDLMGRFVMLFESFWAPIGGQIDTLPYYLDARMTPPEFLPWLASWIDLVLDERWPVDRRRRLLEAAVSLYRGRGTRWGLEEYLEIYTGVRPQIVEHRAHNFRLGHGARLGPGIALGRSNEPHTFTVVLHLPPAPAQQGQDGAPCDDALALPQPGVRRLRIEEIIEAEKPAHTAYTLKIEPSQAPAEAPTLPGIESEEAGL